MADTQTGNGGAPDRAAVLAELANLNAKAPPAEEAAPVEAEAPESAPAPVEAAAPEASDDADEAETAAEAKPAPAVDPDTEKRLKTIQAQEKRARELIAKERAAFEAERTEFAAQRAEFDRFKQFAERAKYDPASVLEALGVPPEEFESAARHLFARSKAAASDPKWKAAAEEAARKSKEASELDAIRREVAELKAERQREAQQSQLEQAKAGYFAQVSAAVTDDAPLLKNFVAKSPAKARDALFQVAASIFEATGEPPDPADVIGAWEKQRRDELAELGLDAAAYLAQQKAAPAEPAKRPAKTLGAATGATPTKTPTNKAEERETVLAELRKLRGA